MALLLVYKEQIETQIMIGGLNCFVKASYVNGKVCGWLNSQQSTRKYEFEFQPMKALRKKLLIVAEIKRLYF